MFEFTADAKDLLTQLKAAKSRLPHNRNLPVLNYFKLEARSGKLFSTRTDLDYTRIQRIRVDGLKGKGALLVRADALIRLITNIPSGKVSVTATKNGMTFSYGKNKSMTAKADVDPENFPQIVETKNTFAKLKKSELDRMVGSVKHAMSNDETKFNLRGVLFHLHRKGKSGEKHLRAIASDGHRLALSKLKSDIAWNDANRHGVFFVPIMVAELLAEKCPDATVTIGYSANESQFNHKSYVTIGETTFICRSDVGQFPDYDRVIPDKTANAFEVKVAELEPSLKRVKAAYSGERDRKGFAGVKLSFNAGKLRLLTSDSADFEVDEELKGTRRKGGEVTAAYSSKYLIDTLSVVGDSAVFNIESATTPALITTKSDKNFLGVIMPMRF